MGDIHFIQALSEILDRRQVLPASLVRRRFVNWRRDVELFKSALGVRPHLIHIGESEWAAHYVANDDAFDAVLDNLQGAE